MLSRRIFSVLTLVLLCQSEICGSLKILGVFPHPAKSHFVMTGMLSKELALRGHHVDVISQFPQKKPVQNYKDIVVKREHGISVNNVTYSDVQQFSSLPIGIIAKMAGTDVCDLLRQPDIQEVLRTKKGYYDVIIVELFIAHCYLAIGQHLKAPVVGVVTSKLSDWLYEPFANPLNPSYMPSLFSTFGQRMTFVERLKNTLLTNFLKHTMNYFMENQVEQVEKYFGRKISSMQELYDDVSLILVNSHHSLNDVKPTTPDIVEVGGLHVVDDDQRLPPDLQRWLDDSTDGCVFFTFGSMVKIESYPEKTVKIFYEMFERIAPVRVLVKIANASELLPGLPKNVKTAPWMPQVAVLKHKNVKLFITHGGLMGTQEAVAHKVPMVGLPIFGDQHVNIRSYAEKKIAVALNLDETLTADVLTNAVMTVLTDPTYKNNIEKISTLFWDRPKQAIDTAVYWVEYAARHGKVLKSPASELAWWQFYLLDVYGFILITISIVLYFIKKIFSLLFRLVCSSKQNRDSSRNISKCKKSQ